MKTIVLWGITARKYQENNEYQIYQGLRKYRYDRKYKQWHITWKNVDINEEVKRHRIKIKGDDLENFMKTTNWKEATYTKTDIAYKGKSKGSFGNQKYDQEALS